MRQNHIAFGVIGSNSQVFKDRFLPACQGIGNGIVATELTDIYPPDYPQVQAMLKQLNLSPDKYHQVEGDNGVKPYFCDDINVLYIAPPNSYHFPWVSQAIEYGIPYLLEKPPAHNVEQAEMIVDLTKHSDVLGYLTLHYYHQSICLRFYELLESGVLDSLGRIKRVYGVLLETDDLSHLRAKWLFEPTISGGGIGIDTLEHPLSITMGFGAEHFEVIKAQWDTCLPPDQGIGMIGSQKRSAETVFQAVLRPQGPVFAKDALSCYLVGKKMPRWMARKGVWVFFEGGTAILEFPQKPRLPRLQVQRDSDILYDIVDATPPYTNIVLAFRQMLTGTKDGLRTLEIGRDCTRTIFEAYDRCELMDFYGQVAVKKHPPVITDWAELDESAICQLPFGWSAALPSPM